MSYLFCFGFIRLLAIAMSQVSTIFITNIIITRGVRLAKSNFGSVFGSVCPKTAVFGSVSVLPN